MNKQYMQTYLMGIDLAWQGNKNLTAAAVGVLDGKELKLTNMRTDLVGISAVLSFIDEMRDLTGVAIDAPLIINNQSGQRDCEKLLSKAYGSRKASCHTSNLKLYPNADSVVLSMHLSARGFHHLNREKWQIECYPHPAIIECFNLSERLLYKKGRVAQKKLGQIKLAEYIKSLSKSSIVKLKIPSEYEHLLSSDYIESLRGGALKSNEDALDAIVCLYIAALYQTGDRGEVFGDIENGYIWVPQIAC